MPRSHPKPSEVSLSLFHDFSRIHTRPLILLNIFLSYLVPIRTSDFNGNRQHIVKHVPTSLLNGSNKADYLYSAMLTPEEQTVAFFCFVLFLWILKPRIS